MYNQWIVLGSSINAPAMLEAARVDYPDATTMTTNAGIDLIRPDYYFLSDQIACKRYGKLAIQQQAQGTKLVTLKRLVTAMKRRGLDGADIFLELLHAGQPLDFTRGVINDCMFSGLFCAQFAIENGAKLIALPGHEGYPPGQDDSSYWDPSRNRLTESQRKTHTQKWIAPWWQKVVELCDDITFHFYGDLNYEITGANVRKTPCKSKCLETAAD